MLSQIAVRRTSKARRNGDVLDVLEHLGQELGSPTNAAVLCILDSPRFKRAESTLARTDKSPKQPAARGAKKKKGQRQT